MIVNQAHILFNLQVDKADALNSPNFKDEERDLYLTEAQEEYIENEAYPEGKRAGVEETQPRVQNLQDITTNANIITFVNNANNKPNGTFVQLPANYRHALDEEVTVSYTDCNNQTVQERIPVYALTHDKYNKIQKNPFVKPNLNKAYRLPYTRDNSGRQQFEIIIGAGQTLVTYHLRFLFTPRPIDKAQILNPLGLPGTSQMDMSDAACRKIVRLAVRNAIGDLGSEREQSAVLRVKEAE